MIGNNVRAGYCGAKSGRAAQRGLDLITGRDDVRIRRIPIALIGETDESDLAQLDINLIIADVVAVVVVRRRPGRRQVSKARQLGPSD